MQTDNTAVRMSATLVMANLLSGCAVKVGTLDLRGMGSVFSQPENACSVRAVSREAAYYKLSDNAPDSIAAFTRRLAYAMSCELQREQGGNWDINPDGQAQAQQNYRAMSSAFRTVKPSSGDSCRKIEWIAVSTDGRGRQATMSLRVCNDIRDDEWVKLSVGSFEVRFQYK